MVKTCTNFSRERGLRAALQDFLDRKVNLDLEFRREELTNTYVK